MLHDRRMPGGAGNIDHLAVASTGVFVIDAKQWSGKVRVSAPLLGQPRLVIAGRDRTHLLDGFQRQVAAVVATLGPDANQLAVHGVLCFTKADLPLLGVTRIRGHALVYRKTLAKVLNRRGPIGTATIERLARKLARDFPAA